MQASLLKAQIKAASQMPAKSEPNVSLLSAGVFPFLCDDKVISSPLLANYQLLFPLTRSLHLAALPVALHIAPPSPHGNVSARPALCAVPSVQRHRGGQPWRGGLLGHWSTFTACVISMPANENKSVS